MEKPIKKVVPCGFLFSQGRSYFLIKPEPLTPKWEECNALRFLAVPSEKMETAQIERDGLVTTTDIYYHPRDVVVTDPFVIEYRAGMPELTVVDLSEEHEDDY